MWEKLRAGPRYLLRLPMPMAGALNLIDVSGRRDRKRTLFGVHRCAKPSLRKGHRAAVTPGPALRRVHESIITHYPEHAVQPLRRVHRYAKHTITWSTSFRGADHAIVPGSPSLRKAIVIPSTPFHRYAKSIVTRGTPLRGAHRSAEQTMPSFRGSPSLRKAIVIPSTPFHRYAKSIVTRSTPCHRYAKHTVTWSTPYHRSAKSIVTRSTS